MARKKSRKKAAVKKAAVKKAAVKVDDIPIRVSTLDWELVWAKFDSWFRQQVEKPFSDIKWPDQKEKIEELVEEAIKEERVERAIMKAFNGKGK